jgi:hypothetical protein
MKRRRDAADRIRRGHLSAKPDWEPEDGPETPPGPEGDA